MQRSSQSVSEDDSRSLPHRNQTPERDGPNLHALPPRRTTASLTSGQGLKRNEAFRPSHYPLRHHPTLRPDVTRIRGPVSFFNPTRAHFQATLKPSTQEDATSRSSDEDHIQVSILGPSPNKHNEL